MRLPQQRALQIFQHSWHAPILFDWQLPDAR
jgi:hypothetical protein